jgi:hypothetical protein
MNAPVFLVLALSALAHAQSLTVTATGPVRAGTTFTATVAIAGTPAVAATNFTMQLPPGWTINGTPAPGTSALAAQKLIHCGSGATPICVVYGANRTVIAPGPIAVFQLSVPMTAAGPTPVSLAGIVGASAAAAAIPLTTLPVSVEILSIYDLNSDGLVDAVDMQVVLDQITGAAPCGTADFTGDGKCDSLDLMKLIMRGVLGL